MRTRCQINRFVLKPISSVTTLPGISQAQGTEPSSDWRMSANLREIGLNYAYCWRVLKPDALQPVGQLEHLLLSGDTPKHLPESSRPAGEYSH